MYQVQKWSTMSAKDAVPGSYNIFWTEKQNCDENRTFFNFLDFNTRSGVARFLSLFRRKRWCDCNTCKPLSGQARKVNNSSNEREMFELSHSMVESELSWIFYVFPANFLKSAEIRNPSLILTPLKILKQF